MLDFQRNTALDNALVIFPIKAKQSVPRSQMILYGVLLFLGTIYSWGQVDVLFYVYQSWTKHKIRCNGNFTLRKPA